jgi:hypothetical protein
MKKLLLLTTLSIALFSFTSILQSDVANAVKAGNAEQISSYFDNMIDLALPGKDEIKNMSKNQASIAVKTFFDDNGIKSGEVTSQRELGPTMYMSGKLQGKTKSFNITLILKNKDGKYQITSVRIN